MHDPDKILDSLDGIMRLATGSPRDLGSSALLELVIMVEKLGKDGAERRRIASQILDVAVDRADGKLKDIYRSARRFYDAGMDRVLVAALHDSSMIKRAKRRCVPCGRLAKDVSRHARHLNAASHFLAVEREQIDQKDKKTTHGIKAVRVDEI